MGRAKRTHRRLSAHVPLMMGFAALYPSYESGASRDLRSRHRGGEGVSSPAKAEGRMEDERDGDRMSRRTVIGAAAASLAAGAASAQAPQPHVKGPRVWLDFD